MQPILSNQIRFAVYDGEKLIHQTEWTKEVGRLDATNALANVRKRIGGNYAYRIERTGDSKTPNPIPMVRFRIKVLKDTSIPVAGGVTIVKAGEIQFSVPVYEKDKEKALAEIRLMFPDSEITEGVA